MRICLVYMSFTICLVCMRICVVYMSFIICLVCMCICVVYMSSKICLVCTRICVVYMSSTICLVCMFICVVIYVLCRSPTIPVGPALFGLSWDAGNASRRRSYTPILISVGNTDYSGLHTYKCVAYMPKLLLSEEMLKTDLGKRARHELVQQCITAIVKVIEQAGAKGFKCTLQGVAPTEWCLFPVLSRMELDTKERYKFFACARQRACAIGSGPRLGRSAFRMCTPHASRKDLELLRRTAAFDEDSADSLNRRGMHPHYRCTAIDRCRTSIIRWPERIYHGSTLCTHSTSTLLDIYRRLC